MVNRREPFTTRDARDIYLEVTRLGRWVRISDLARLVQRWTDRTTVAGVFEQLARQQPGRVELKRNRHGLMVRIHN